MATGIDVYLEVGSKRIFAGALEWPGWCRIGKDEEGALQALIDYGPRYKAALGGAAAGLSTPSDAGELDVVERLDGNATTDFGAPDRMPSGDDRTIDEAETERLAGLMKAVWAKFDKTAKTYAGFTLRKGPRGGGRDLDKIVRHVAEGEMSYLYRLGGKFHPRPDAESRNEILRLRRAFLDMMRFRARGEVPPLGRRTAKLWPARFAVRRAAWHVLDHAWEIEDRAE